MVRMRMASALNGQMLSVKIAGFTWFQGPVIVVTILVIVDTGVVGKTPVVFVCFVCGPLQCVSPWAWHRNEVFDQGAWNQKRVSREKVAGWWRGLIRPKCAEGCLEMLVAHQRVVITESPNRSDRFGVRYHPIASQDAASRHSMLCVGERV